MSKTKLAWDDCSCACKALEYLHYNQVAHRDIKPDNILLTEDRRVCKLVDFGVSAIAKPGDDRTESTVGTPAFRSPEMCTVKHGKISTFAADIWALGVTTYCMLTGRLPFKGSEFEIDDIIVNSPCVASATDSIANH